MNLPEVVADLVTAQNNFDSVAYANCFSDTAVVFDEGKTHRGKKEIERWIADANERYQAVMQPLSFEETETESLLKAEVLGSFPGSPLLMRFHLGIVDNLIQSFKTTT